MVIKIPTQANKPKDSRKNIQAKITVMGGARMVINKDLLAPSRLMASKNMVSPKPMPIAPLTARARTAAGRSDVKVSPITRLVMAKRMNPTTPLIRFNSSGRMVFPSDLNRIDESAHKNAPPRAQILPENGLNS